MSPIEKVITIRRLHDPDTSALEYWLTRPIAERIDFIEELRMDHHGRDYEAEPRLPGLCRVLHRA